MCKKCRFCCLGRSASVIIAAVYTLIESGLFFAATGFALLAHKCRTPMQDTNKYLYGFYTIYLRNPECGSLDLAKLGINLPEGINVEFTLGLTPPIERTILFSWIYIGLNGFWIVASMMLLIGGLRTCSGRVGHYIYWLPWIFTTLASIVFDVVVAIYYGTDLKQTGTFLNFLEWMGVSNIDVIRQYVDDIASNVLSIPVYVMIAFSLRFAILELINIFCLIMVTFIWFEILGEFVDEKPKRSDTQPRPIINPAFEPDEAVESVRSETVSVTSVPVVVKPQNNNRFIKNNEKVADDDEVEKRLKNFQRTTSNGTSVQRSPEDLTKIRWSHSTEKSSPRALAPKEPPPDYLLHNSPIHDIPAPDYDSEPEEIEKPRNQVTRSTSNVQNLKQTIQQAYERPRERSASPVVEVTDDGNVVSRNSSFARPELRNQLPWSYFNKTEEVAPMRSLVHPITGERMTYRATLSPEQVSETNEPDDTTDEARSRF